VSRGAARRLDRRVITPRSAPGPLTGS